MTPQERLRKHQRALEKTQRELDRERVKLENQEKKLIQDIKKSAKNGQMGACKIQAKDLVRTRRYVQSHDRCFLSATKSRAINIAETISHPSKNLHQPTSISTQSLTLPPQIHLQIRLHAHPTPSNIPPHPNRPLQRTNGPINARRHLPPSRHEPLNEPPCPPKNSNGIRERKRYHGSTTRNDG